MELNLFARAVELNCFYCDEHYLKNKLTVELNSGIVCNRLLSCMSYLHNLAVDADGIALGCLALGLVLFEPRLLALALAPTAALASAPFTALLAVAIL